MNDIAVVVPTIREDCLKTFYEAWKPLFKKHEVYFIVVRDGDKPVVSCDDIIEKTPEQVLGKEADLLYNKNDGVRNLGFAFIAKYLPQVETIITLDDDVLPIDDPIESHLMALESPKPVSWLSTLLDDYPRGFPYGIRDEAEVVLSHGAWQGVADWDAPTQLVNGNLPVEFYRGPIPRGVYFPMCGMNLAFKRKLLPYVYYAPMGYRVGLDRFADIWLGVLLKDIIDKRGWAVVSGYAPVRHERASNVWTNLKKEASGLELNEGFWQGKEDNPYFKEYRQARKRWEKLIKKYERS
jgi:reversibly glycosylated polypeptide/UDP-arabinopyranose mutase